MELSLGKLLIMLVIVMLVFGAGRLPRVMGDFGKGIRALREGLKAEDEKEISSNQKKSDDVTPSS